MYNMGPKWWLRGKNATMQKNHRENLVIIPVKGC